MYKQHLIVRERPDGKSPDPEFGNMANRVICDIPKCCNSFSQGKCELEASFKKNSFYPNETAHASLKINNTQSEVGCSSVNFSVNQHIKLG